MNLKSIDKTMKEIQSFCIAGFAILLDTAIIAGLAVAFQIFVISEL